MRRTTEGQARLNEENQRRQEEVYMRDYVERQRQAEEMKAHFERRRRENSDTKLNSTADNKESGQTGLRDARTMEYNSTAVHEAVEANKVGPGSAAISMGSFKGSDDTGNNGT